MAQAITTKFIGPTNTKDSRIKASCWRASVIVSYDHALNSDANHKAAIEALVNKLNDERSSDAYVMWEVLAVGNSADGKGMTAIIDLN